MNVEESWIIKLFTRSLIIIMMIITTIFIVLSSTAPAICESSLRFVWAKVYAVDVGLLEPRVAVA